MKRRYRSSGHQRRIDTFAHVPHQRPRWPRLGPDFFWNADQERASAQRFLIKKWFYDNDSIRAYGANMRLLARRMNKALRQPKGDRT